MISGLLTLVLCTLSSSGVTAQLAASNLTSTVKGSIVDLGYSQYQGYVDSSSQLEYFLGIRYAAPPGRFQAPTKPLNNRTAVIQGNAYGPICAQTVPNAFLNTVATATSANVTGSEDCLYLNVWRPANVSTAGLPVLVWIHGGGYGLGNGRNDPTYLTQLVSPNFVFVSIQYRLGAFGFLSSTEVKEKGALNAGLLDQNRALNWVQDHIGSFGGDPDQVTIFGESAGAGSVMLQLLSYGGSLGTTLFQRGIAASPYLPKQYNYFDTVPTKAYQMLAAEVGCSYQLGNFEGLFECLSSASFAKLAIASNIVSAGGFYGTWAFVPVTDGTFVTQVPSAQLLTGKLNGASVMVGNNADEGLIFTLMNITTSADLKTYVQTFLPTFTNTSLANLYRHYPEPELSGGLYSTQFARAALIYGDSTFNCPGNWLADAYTSSYRYQYSVPVALHGLDVPNYLPTPGAVLPFTNLSQIFDRALLSFAFTGVPSLSNKTVQYPAWNALPYGQQVDFNLTAGVQYPIASYTGISPNISTLDITGSPNITIQSGLRLTNHLDRCTFWRAYAGAVPE